jgi:hypothetical protein
MGWNYCEWAATEIFIVTRGLQLGFVELHEGCNWDILSYVRIATILFLHSGKKLFHIV